MGRVQVWNGDTVAKIEEALDQHFEHLADIAEGVNHQEAADEFKRNPGSVVLDATGAGVIELDSAQGFDRRLERVSIMVSGATIGNCGLFIDSVNPTNLAEFVTPAQQVAATVSGLGAFVVYADAFNNNIYVPQASRLFIQFSGYTAGATAVVALQEKYLKKAEHTHHLRRVNNGAS